MGMSYSICADKETHCPDEFPGDLSFFLEQYGGYDEHSEIGQVSTLLDIDLSCFLHYDWGTNNEREEQHFWQDLNPFSSKVLELITKIEQKPAYFEAVKHGQNRHLSFTQIMEAFQRGDEAKAEELFYTDANLYPPDYGYLSSGRIIGDLQKLRATLECYQKNGVKKIKLTYM